jgi:sterol desaturase/sphingolipid hydroxylase (fatty acid hydroxylase superfamily)
MKPPDQGIFAVKPATMPHLFEQFGQHHGPLAAWLLISSFIFLRYALPSSLAYNWLYKWKSSQWILHKIQQKLPSAVQIRHEISYSLLTSFIFGGLAIGVYFLRKMGVGALYFNIADYGWAYYFFSIAVMIVVHDTYFYWTHRLMHHPRLFRLFHLVHHRSNNPTPYAAFSFHPLESVIEFGIVPLTAIFLPMHASALFLFTIWSIFFNVLGHCGYELAPSGFTRHWLLKWFNTSTHHNLHHEKSGYNFGLYFNFWDRLMGTNHPHYDQIFEDIKTRSKTGSKSSSPLKKASIIGTLLLLSTCAFGQLDADDLKSGNYGTPERRAAQLDKIMADNLDLNANQREKVKAINLKYARRTEAEVIQKDLSKLSRYSKIMSIQNDKDTELKQVLDKKQFDQYRKKRDEQMWKALKGG